MFFFTNPNGQLDVFKLSWLAAMLELNLMFSRVDYQDIKVFEAYWLDDG